MPSYLGQGGIVVVGSGPNLQVGGPVFEGLEGC